MHLIGWSTGAILPKSDKANFPLAIKLLKSTPFTCIEFSVLREWELPIFLEYLPDLDISSFDRVSFHACKREKLTEQELFKKIEPVIEKGWPIIYHPDIMHDWDMWNQLGNQLLIENMESRKPIGKTVEEMEQIFDKLPDASMCFDIGHAREVDPTMLLSRDLCLKFGDKIKEMHVSDIDPVSYGHKPINHNSLRAFGRISDFLPDCPILLESAPSKNIEREVEYIISELPMYGMPLFLRKGKML